ncbi:AbrB/MazE/SpoVT family DNA-binding domain-containing protein, partial [candidate division KSB1 bacterium]|nr:AbrB/MazE/SpoVT family DNA-binding domain-containing protein [candidate division KSB1 bacterium]
PVRKPRQGWEEAFQEMAKQGEDQLLDKEELPYQSSWDQDDWVW